MKVLIVSTSDLTGGAAIAANRLCNALNNNGVKTKMLVRDRLSTDIRVATTGASWTNRMRFALERLLICLHNGFSRDNLFAIDTGYLGNDITETDEFKEADVIHLHWINQGFLSLNGLQKILRSGKTVVWTMHDMWACTGICHYAGSCTQFHTHCQQCPLLRHPGKKDLSYHIFDRKQKLYATAPIHFVTCSHWLEEEARQSALLHKANIRCIANALDTNLFRPYNREEARRILKLPQDKKLLLFGSVKVTDKRKGIDYLIESARLLAQQTDEKHRPALVIMGQNDEQMSQLFPFDVYPMGYVTDPNRQALIYSAADAFVIPSLFENLPNTIAEAMACGTPCVAFRAGGMPEMIDHLKDGYLAAYENSADLAEGIRYVCQHPELGEAARHHAVQKYNESRVANEYMKVYEQLTTY